MSHTCRYLGSFPTAEEAARAFDAMAIQNGRPVETLNFPAAYGGPTVGQAYRKRKVHKLYPDPSHQINVLLQKLADVDRSNPGILRLTMGTLGVPETRYLVRSCDVLAGYVNHHSGCLMPRLLVKQLIGTNHAA